ncbi:phage baseplate assembly protein V [Chromobacterium haemolyticum]|nr:phage baseplate assembly protein V [Chromobacterium haemolyticum]
MMDVPLPEALATLKFGSVSAVDANTQRVRVRLPELGRLRTAWLPVLSRKSGRDKDYWLPDIGEQVAVLLDARGEDGVVLGAIFSAADAVPVASVDKWHRRFADGATLEYDRAAHQLTVSGGVQKVVVEAGADIVLKAGAKVSIDAPATEISGTLLVKGLLTYQGGLSGSAAAAAPASPAISARAAAASTTPAATWWPAARAWPATCIRRRAA